jgi:hypothetical protein
VGVTREALYAEVWAEPMTTVALRYGVSSSFLARVCERLGVPRPPRGYWAQLKVGKAATRPPLPAALPGSELEWTKDGLPRPRAALRPQPPDGRRRSRVGPRPDRHPLVVGVKEFFENTWPVSESGYLRPRKRLLPDLHVTAGALARALDVASELYLALEDRGHHVRFAPADGSYRRPDIDHREHPSKQQDFYFRDRWNPARPTLVFVGTVAIGLTLVERSQRTEVRYVNGKYVPVSTLPATKAGRLQRWSDWTTHHDLPTGCLVLRAFSPYPRAQWSQEWAEKQAGELSTRFGQITKALEAAAPVISALVEEGEREAELERQRWEIEHRERARQEAERRRIEALKDSREQLLEIVSKWGRARQIEVFFEEATRAAQGLPSSESTRLLARLTRARELLGGIDPLHHFDAWQSPEDRVKKTLTKDE